MTEHGPIRRCVSAYELLECRAAYTPEYTAVIGRRLSLGQWAGDPRLGTMSWSKLRSWITVHGERWAEQVEALRAITRGH